MEKKTLKDRIQNALAALWSAVKAHPVEIFILVYSCTAVCLLIAFDEVGSESSWWFRPVYIAPFTVVAAYTLQAFRDRGVIYRMIYLIPLLLTFAACAMRFLPDCLESPSYFIALFIALPLWMCLRHGKSDNLPFVQRNVRMVCSLAGALLVAGILYVLYGLIVFSVKTLFDITDSSWNGWYLQAVVWLFLGLAPTLFFAFEDKNSELYIRRFGTVLLNWVLTPALLIYMAVLYVYAAKILFTWNLPKGGVSIMVGVFVGVVMLAKMLQLLVDKHPFRWFYDHFSLFALPLLVLFWTAVGRRLSDHGLTESRYYLVLCGVFMTLFVVLFLFSNKKGYFMLAAAAFVVVVAMVCIPPLSGERVAQRAQIHRVRSYARQLGRLNEDGTLRLAEPDPADTLDIEKHRKLYQSLEYVSDHNSTLMSQELGIEYKSDYLTTLSEETRQYASAYIAEEVSEEGENIHTQLRTVYLYNHLDTPLEVEGYKRMYFSLEKAIEGEDGLDITADWIFKKQLEKLGCPDNQPTKDWLEDHEQELMVYRTDSLMVVFSNLTLSKNEQDKWEVDWCGEDFVLVR